MDGLLYCNRKTKIKLIGSGYQPPALANCSLIGNTASYPFHERGLSKEFVVFLQNIGKSICNI